MTGQPDGQDDLASGIFRDVEYARPQTEPKEFKPWHRPRKQFVRRAQLSALLRRLYEGRGSADPLSYLGLPGTDLIDLRYLHEELCRADDRPLRFLGLNTEARPGNPAHVQLSVSLDEVRRLPNVDAQSEVIHDDFRRIGNPSSIAWSRARRLGPFDVVNIDLCDGFASDPPQKEGTVYKALDQLMALQARNPNAWLLLVTTRIGRGMFDEDAQERLLNLFDRNVKNCEGFSQACEQHLDLDAQSVDPETCSEADLVNLMCVAIGKWLSALVQVHAPSRVQLASTHGYRVNPVAVREDLISLALRVEPVIAASPDAFSLTRPIPDDECSSAEAIVRRAARRRDVDTILEERPELREQLIGEMEHLLANARYDVGGYREWLTS